MSFTSAQLIAQACQIAKAPGYTAQAGMYLNMVLSTLCKVQDFDYIKKKQTIDATTGISFPLAADHLRTKEVLYSDNGNPVVMYQLPIATYRARFTDAQASSGSAEFAVDVSTTPNTLYLVRGIGGPLDVWYYPLMPDIVSPETSTEVPWFEDQEYLLVRTASMLMRITDDERQPLFDVQAEKMLGKYLPMKDDKTGFSDTIKLSRERFRSGGGAGASKSNPLG